MNDEKKPETHVHAPAWRLQKDAYIEVCDCGAPRENRPPAPPTEWHTCALCTPYWGRP
jgi:hypothetical protein